MEPREAQRAVAAGMATASALGLRVDDAAILHSSNRLAVHLLPCNTLARVAPVEQQLGADFEVMVAQRLSETDCPVAQLDPRVEPLVSVRDGFALTFWTYYEPASTQVAPAEYAQALVRLHAGMRQAEVLVPEFTARVAEAQGLIDNPDLTPDLGDADRGLLGMTLGSLSLTIASHKPRAQLLHGEPHPDNLLRTKRGLLFADLETCCRGPVEFDVAHAPEEVCAAYPDLDTDLLRECRILTLAVATAWRWDRHDQFPNGHQVAIQWISQLRALLDDYGLDIRA